MVSLKIQQRTSNEMRGISLYGIEWVTIYRLS